MSAAGASQLFIFTQWMTHDGRVRPQRPPIHRGTAERFSATASCFEQMLVAQETEGADEFVIVEEEEK